MSAEPMIRGVRPRPDVAVVAIAFSEWLCGLLSDEQRAALTETQRRELRWAIQQGYANGYEAAVEDQTGQHRPSLDREQRGFEPEIQALHVAATTHAGGDDPWDNLRRALARRNEALAQMVDANPAVAWLFRDLGAGLLLVCKRRGWEPARVRTHGMVTPDDRIVVTVEHGA